MPTYEIALLTAVVLFAILSVMQIVMRQQVHQARFGNQEISPWDVRFSNNLLGQHGIWKLHKQAYERSLLRPCFTAVSLALLVSILVAIGDFFYARHGHADISSPGWKSIGGQLLASGVLMLSGRQDLGLRAGMGAAFGFFMALAFGISALVTAVRARVWGGPAICAVVLCIEICLILRWCLRRTSA